AGLRVLAHLPAGEVGPDPHRHALGLTAGVAGLRAERQRLWVEILLRRSTRVVAGEEVADVAAPLEILGVDDPVVVGDGVVLEPHEADPAGVPALPAVDGRQPLERTAQRRLVPPEEGWLRRHGADQPAHLTN